MPITSSFVYSCLALIMSVSVADEIALEEAARRDACIELIDTSPEDAYEMGLAWQAQSNRPGAQYCTALSLIALGREAEGAFRLETLANMSGAGTLEEIGRYLAQSGNAWLAAGLPEEAIITLTNALKVLPEDADIHEDRARAHLLLENWPEGVKDLTRAFMLGATPDAGPLTLRAEALLRLGELDAAMSDVEQAMALAPEDLDVLLLRGRVREAMRLRD